MSHSLWIIRDTGIANAARNMELDVQFLGQLDETSSTPILHLYDWEAPSATYGHFIDPHQHLSQDSLRANYLQIAKRPTGGGLIFHTTDWAFSVLIPAGHEAYSVNTIDNYVFINTLLIKVINRFMGRSVFFNLLPRESIPTDSRSGHFCMAKPTKYDVMLEGKKVGGGAQRRTKSGFLHQGTISLAIPDEGFLEKVLLPGTGVHQAMHENTYALMENKPTPAEIHEARQYLKACFQAEVKSG